MTSQNLHTNEKQSVHEWWFEIERCHYDEGEVGNISKAVIETWKHISEQSKRIKYKCVVEGFQTRPTIKCLHGIL